MAQSYAELRSTSKETLVREYDRIAGHTQLGLDFYSSEIARRDAAEETAKIVEMSQQMLGATLQMRDTTQQMLTLTAVMIGLTVVNTLLVGYSLLT